MSEGTQQPGNESYSSSDSNSTTLENDMSPKGPLATLLNLDILLPPNRDTSTIESGDGDGYYSGPAGGQG